MSIADDLSRLRSYVGTLATQMNQLSDNMKWILADLEPSALTGRLDALQGRLDTLTPPPPPLTVQPNDHLEQRVDALSANLAALDPSHADARLGSVQDQLHAIAAQITGLPQWQPELARLATRMDEMAQGLATRIGRVDDRISALEKDMAAHDKAHTEGNA